MKRIYRSTYDGIERSMHSCHTSNIVVTIFWCIYNIYIYIYTYRFPVIRTYLDVTMLYNNF